MRFLEALGCHVNLMSEGMTDALDRCGTEYPLFLWIGLFLRGFRQKRMAQF